jgi:IS66 Orf2 like protein
MEARARRFRKQVQAENGGRRGTRLRYSEKLRAEALRYVEGRRREGASAEQAASELGVSKWSLSRWWQSRGSSATLRRVEVVETEAAKMTSPILVTPRATASRGCRKRASYVWSSVSDELERSPGVGVGVCSACRPAEGLRRAVGPGGERAEAESVERRPVSVREPEPSPAKVLHWDGTGLCVYAKRLERGRFACLWSSVSGEREGEPIRPTTSELNLFLEGSRLVGKIALSPSSS